MSADRVASVVLSREVTDALRCHFADVGGCYVGHNAWSGMSSLYWWIMHLGKLSTVDPLANRRVFSLRTAAQKAVPTQRVKAHQFALAFQYTEHWRACARRAMSEEGQKVKADPDEQLMAWLDLLLFIAWKYLASQTQLTVVYKGLLGYPFFSLTRDTTESDDGLDLFTADAYIGLRSLEQAYRWRLEWTEEGYMSYLEWGLHHREIVAMTPLSRRLIDDRTEASLQRSYDALVLAVKRKRSEARGESRVEPHDLRIAGSDLMMQLSQQVTELKQELKKYRKASKKRSRTSDDDDDDDERDLDEDADDEGESEDPTVMETAGDEGNDDDADDNDQDQREEGRDESCVGSVPPACSCAKRRSGKARSRLSSSQRRSPKKRRTITQDWSMILQRAISFVQSDRHTDSRDDEDEVSLTRRRRHRTLSQPVPTHSQR